MTSAWTKLGDVTPSAFRPTVQWLKYVTHDAVPEYLAKGWVVSDTLDGTPHSHFAVLMVWKGEGEPT